MSFVLKGSNVGCKFSLPEDLWPAEIDEGQISQVINNLVINADQAMPKGGTIQVSAENITTGQEHSLPLTKGKYIKICIHDQGVGISKECLQKIFDPYFTTKGTGTGLGLAISYSIIKKHNGYITVESKEGAGATFCVYLPASEKSVLPKKQAEVKPSPGRGKVLLMDDDKNLKEMVGEMIAYIGYEVEFARNGQEAVELYEKAKKSGSPFDAVIMDLIIPGGMGGHEAARKLLEMDPKAKVIVSSGYSNDPIMSDFKHYGFCNVLAKPYEIKNLSTVLQSAILGLQGELGQTPC